MMTDQTKHNIEMLHTGNKSRKHERDKVQNEMDDAMEALSVLDSAIACGFLKDKHSLIAQEWCKEYQKDIDNCRMFLDNSPDLTDIVKEHKENKDGK